MIERGEHKSRNGFDCVKGVQLQTLQDNFKSLSRNRFASISVYFNYMQTIVKQLRVNGEELNDVQVVD